MPDYNPTIQSLLEQCETDWGNPVTNRANLVPYGIRPLDLALYGIDPNGELIVIQGEQKNRKTTLAANILVNIMTWDKLLQKPVINIDTLESGMRPKKYRDVLISMVATRYLIEQGHRPHETCPMCGIPECKHLGISPKFLIYNSRTQAQKDAIDYAIAAIEGWPLLIHGASIREGDTRNLRSATLGTREDKARWFVLVQEYGVKIIVVDHIQQYGFSDEPTDYEKQIRAVSAIGDFSSQYNVTFLALSQVSLTSLRSARDNGTKLTAAGGAKAAQEANTVLSVSYKPGSGVMKIRVEESRDAGIFSVWQRLEDTSGCFYGEASTTPPSEISL